MAVRKSTSLVVVAALVAAAGTGATLALWETSADLADATISSGSMSVEALDQSAADISGDVDGNPQPIILDPASPDVFKVVPGDTIRVAQTITVTTVGDNIEANLAIGTATGGTFAAGAVGGGNLSPYLILDSVELYEGDQAAAVLSGDPMDPISTKPGTYYLPGEMTAKPYTVVYEVTFDPATAGVDGMNASAILQTTAATLEQVRPTPTTP